MVDGYLAVTDANLVLGRILPQQVLLLSDFSLKCLFIVIDSNTVDRHGRFTSSKEKAYHLLQFIHTLRCKVSKKHALEKSVFSIWYTIEDIRQYI